MVIEIEDKSKIDEIALMILGGDHDIAPIQVVIVDVHRAECFQNTPNIIETLHNEAEWRGIDAVKRVHRHLLIAAMHFTVKQQTVESAHCDTVCQIVHEKKAKIMECP